MGSEGSNRRSFDCALERSAQDDRYFGCGDPRHINQRTRPPRNLSSRAHHEPVILSEGTHGVSAVVEGPAVACLGYGQLW